jgi:hypothetical protein
MTARARIWSIVGGDVWGYGNGHKAVIYTHVLTDAVTVHVMKGDREIAKHEAQSLSAGKRWAERHYLKGTK